MERDLVSELLEENRLLQERIAELEEDLGIGRSKLERETTQITRVVKLLENKDRILEEYTSELERKREELEDAVNRLEDRNERLELMVSALRLYQDLLEHEPAAILGLNRQGELILFNRAAGLLFGTGIKDLLGRDLGGLPLPEGFPNLRERVKEVLGDFAAREEDIRSQGFEVKISVHPMGSGELFHGVLVQVHFPKDFPVRNPS